MSEQPSFQAALDNSSAENKLHADTQALETAVHGVQDSGIVQAAAGGIVSMFVGTLAPAAVPVLSAVAHGLHALSHALETGNKSGETPSAQKTSSSHSHAKKDILAPRQQAEAPKPAQQAPAQKGSIFVSARKFVAAGVDKGARKVRQQHEKLRKYQDERTALKKAQTGNEQFTNTLISQDGRRSDKLVAEGRDNAERALQQGAIKRNKPPQPGRSA